MAIAYEVTTALISTTDPIVGLIAKWMTLGCFQFHN